MKTNDKLVEIDHVKAQLIEVINDFFGCDAAYFDVNPLDLATHLIANGVTVQQWIPVTERLPDLVPCDAGTAYSEAVNVMTDGRKVLTAIWNGERFLCDADYWEAWGEKITHWTPVLLPLPEPPKEGVR